MSFAPEYPSLDKAELFAGMAQGSAARITVVTPNRRLAQALARDFAGLQVEQGHSAWESADVLPFTAFVARLHEDALYSGLAPHVPLLLSSAQEQALWEESIRGSKLADTLLSPAPAAAQCRAAWKLAHAWCLAGKLAGAAESEDAKAFADWAARYERAAIRHGQTDVARLPDVVAALLDEAGLRKPRTLVLYGFDMVTPQQKAFCAALEHQGVAIAACGMQVLAPEGRQVARIPFEAACDEWHSAAQWARSRLEACAGTSRQPRIGIVVPDLAHSRARVQRIFASVLAPSRALPGEARQGVPFNVSLGEGLNEFALVHDALLGLALGGRELPFADASRLLRSPFLAGAEIEMAARARLDAALRRRAAPLITLDGLQRLIALRDMPSCTVLASRFASLAEFRQRALFGMKPASEWARAFSEALSLLGFPGERSLDSVEYQTLSKWHEAIAGFAALDRVCGRMAHAEALSRLRRIAADTVFQPEASDVPIQIMGVLESAGMVFDHLWVGGMTALAWPIAARPNAFVPVRLQRAAGVPESDPALALELDARITKGWISAAGEVLFSHARREDDRELSPSPLITQLPAVEWQDLGVPEYPRLRDIIHRAAAEERIADAAPALTATGAVQGGTGVFRDQAACPFRAFATHRLGAEALQTPQAGLNVMDRGTLLHELLAAAWNELRTLSALASMDGPALEQLLARCADLAMAKLKRRRPDAIEGRFAELERARLIALALKWMDEERKRADFVVVATEQKSSVTVGGVTVNARLDRMDRLAGGGHVVIDYKTGEAGISDWLGERPDEPQLPLYATTRGEDVAAVAYAQIKVGKLGFLGVAREDGLLPGVKPITEHKRIRLAALYASWNELLGGWRYELDALGAGFAAGDALVAPKKRDTCKHCDLHGLCRINERRDGLDADDVDEGADE